MTEYLNKSQATRYQFKIGNFAGNIVLQKGLPLWVVKNEVISSLSTDLEDRNNLLRNKEIKIGNGMKIENFRLEVE